MESTSPASSTFSGRLGPVAYCHRPGSGPVIVCLHGIGASKSIFSAIFSSPMFAMSEIITIDMLGHGNSSRPAAASYTMEEHVDAIEELLLSVVTRDRQFWLACHSVGGAVGVLLARKLSNRVDALVSIEGNLIASDCGLITRRTISVPLNEFCETLRETLAKEIAGKGEDPSDFLATDPRAFYATAESVVQWSDSGLLLEYFRDQMVSRRAYIYGDRNHDMEILHRLGPIPAISISASGHCMMIDNPTEFYEKLWSTLSGA